ncbi:MAG: ABC transporter ATP-binding protein [Patescibacteria group bacterium]
MAFRDNPIIFLSGKLWEFSAGNRRKVVLYIVLFVFANIIGTLEPFVIAKILDVIQFGGVTQENISFLLLLTSLFVATQIAFWVFWGPARVIEITNAFLARAKYKMYLLEGTLALPAAWHTDHHSGDTIDKIEKGSSGLYRFGTDTFQALQGFMKLGSAFVILSYFSLTSGAIVLVMVVLTIVLILKFDQRLIRQYDEINRADNAIAAKVFDVISNVTTVIILRIEKLVTKAIAKKIHQPFKVFVRNNVINESKWAMVSISGGVMVALVLGTYFYTNLATGSAVVIGTVYLLWSYVMRVTDVFFNFAYQYGDFVQQKTAVMNAERIAHDFQNTKAVPGFRRGAPWKVLDIQSLSFSYHADDGADLHLDDVSMRIARGERIALIGESGSGKTTFLKLLRGLYPSKQSNILLDGKALKNGIEMLSAQIALIPQDPEIFATTIRENVTMGVEYPMAVVKKYSDMARFTNVVERLPHGWESSIVEKGVNLSGGEKQRLALARGLLACADKSIVLLDEPTSSVDMRNELHIYESVFKSFKGKTIISSVHRLHLLKEFDSIYYFERGRIVASGSLDDLLKTSEKFQELWEKYQETQLRGNEDGE